MAPDVETTDLRKAAAKALLDFLSWPGAAAVYKALGMQPGH